MGAGATNETNLKIAQETNQANRDIAAQTNETNLHLAREENAFNERMWNEANKYNDPANQVQRFQNAGLSAAASAQAAGNVGAQPLRSANLANQQMGAPMQAAVMQPQEFLTTMRNAAQLGIEIGDAVKSLSTAGLEREVILTDNDAKRWATQKVMQDWLLGQSQLPYATRKAEADTKSAEGRAAADSKLGEVTDLAMEEKKLNIEMLKKQLYYFDQKSQAEIDEIAKRIEQYDLQGELTKAQTANANAQVDLTKAQTANAYKQGEQIAAQTQNIKDQNAGILADNRIKGLQAIMEETGLPKDFLGVQASLIMKGEITQKEFSDNLKSFKRSSYNLQNSLGNDPVTRQWARELNKHNASGGHIVDEIVEGAEKLNSTINSMFKTSDEHGDVGKDNW